MNTTKEKQKKEKIRLSFLQQLTIVLLVLAAVCAVIAVDCAYGDMMNRKNCLSLEVRRVDQDFLQVSFLEKTGYINTTRIAKEAEKIEKQVKQIAGQVKNEAKRVTKRVKDSVTAHREDFSEML